MKLFRRSTEIDQDLLDRRLATVRLHLLVAMATVDGRMPICELDMLHLSVEALASDLRHRDELEELLFELLDDPPTIGRAAQLVMDEPLAREHSATIVKDLLRMALSDGLVQEAEQRLLSRVQHAFAMAPALCA
ncbi:MAG: hypothetical protein JWL76_1273 [Thermoleophilia bacterium]|nr:hypothetical protein [Thermoleophilia bacterium]